MAGLTHSGGRPVPVIAKNPRWSPPGWLKTVTLLLVIGIPQCWAHMKAIDELNKSFNTGEALRPTLDPFRANFGPSRTRNSFFSISKMDGVVFNYDLSICCGKLPLNRLR